MNVTDALSIAGTVLAVGVAGLLTVAGLALSVLSISGTWLVLVATLVLGVASARPFPGLKTALAFLAVCMAVEGIEAVAGYRGVKSRGGSGWAGAAAVAGGLAGLVLGAALPIPLLGPLVGMMALSFACAFAVEHHRMRDADRAAAVAWGAVAARLGVLFLKCATTLAMAAVLWGGFIWCTGG